ncbi:hypothetical protein [Pusillimonas sp.]|uniref:hypothetical protein n=1 Tax=Pusillimonas sp. TaxID=3040095 RepID=UPI0037C8F803
MVNLLSLRYVRFKMDKKDKATEKAKPEGAPPALKQARWPGQGNSGGIKNAKAGHDRKNMGRGAARGR